MIKSFALGIGLLSATVLASPAFGANGNSLQIFVSKSQQSMVVYDGDQVVATSKVSTGKQGHTTPSGVFSILEKRKYHESNLYSNAPMPWMQRLTWSGIALHESSSVPNYPASHGCVRLPGAFAKSLFQMTERGVHVIITDDPVVPAPVRHAALFSPALPAADGALLSDAELRPATFEGASRPVEVAAVEVLPKAGASTAVSLEKIAPLRILITRRGLREMVVDAQEMLTALGFDAGVADGFVGPQTIGAVNGYKRWKGLSTKGEVMTAEFMEKLYESSGRGKPPLGQILVRQKFKPLFEAPVEITDADVPLGTHFVEATSVNRFAGKAEWHGVTLENHLSPSTRKRLGIGEDTPAPTSIEAALERIVIPENIRHRIALLLDEGSSISISDTGLGPETGAGTDFITITHRAPRA